MTFEQITKDLKNKLYHPVYFLHGEEAFYIDKISDIIEKNVLSESEQEFNQSVLYGKELDILTLVSYAKRYPMMSNHQVIIVKEAQDMKYFSAKEKDDKPKDERNPFIEYLQHPQKSTVLVICYKYKSLDKRTKLAKEIDKHAVMFESKKLYDNKVPEWVSQYVRERGFSINLKATQMIADYLGNDLSKVSNELDKLFINHKKDVEISVKDVEENIGISKDFNVFELQSALGKRNVYKANMIVNYFAANPKNNPMVMTLPQIFSYFIKVLTYHRLPVKEKNAAASALGVNPYFIHEYETASRSYPEQKVLSIISEIRNYDVRSKGVGSNPGDGELMKELVWKILH